jgi:hypothetical protein
MNIGEDAVHIVIIHGFRDPGIQSPQFIVDGGRQFRGRGGRRLGEGDSGGQTDGEEEAQGDFHGWFMVEGRRQRGIYWSNSVL